MRCTAALVIVVVLLIQLSDALNIKPNSIEGTENIPLAFTDKQLGIQRYLASLTFLNTNSSVN